MSDELNGGGARIHRASAWGVENEAFFREQAIVASRLTEFAVIS